jgi:RND superfamily putative drug exporter
VAAAEFPGVRLLETVTGGAVRRPWLTVGAWVLAAVVLVLSAPSLNDVGQQDQSAFLPDGAPSRYAAAVMSRAFPDDPTLNGAVLVFSRPGPLTAGDDRYLTRLPARLQTQLSADVVGVTGTGADPRLRELLRSRDGKVELVLVSLKAAPFSTQAAAAVNRLRSLAGAGAPAGLRVDITGTAAVGRDETSTITDSFATVGIISVLLVLAILLLVYRSLVAAFVPLVTIGVAFAVAVSTVALAAQAGLKVASLAATFMIVLVFGAGTDYCLFLVSRYRTALAAHEDRHTALRSTAGLIAPVVVASGATVVLGFLSQLTARFGFYRSMGPAIAIAIAVTVAAAVTLTPAILELLRHHAFWPAKTSELAAVPAARLHRWQRLAQTVGRYPRETCIGALATLTLLASGLGWLHTSTDLAGELPANAPSRVGADVVARHFAAGTIAPVSLLVSAPDGRALPTGVANSAAVDALTDALRAVPGVADVKSPTQPAGHPLYLDPHARPDRQLTSLGIDPNKVDVTPLYNALASPRGLRLTGTFATRYPALARASNNFLGRDRSAFRFVITLQGDPYADRAQQVVNQLVRITRTRLAGDAAGAVVSAAGPGPTFADIGRVATADGYRIAGMLFLIIILVLVTLLRSWLLPLLLAGTALLSYAAALGFAALAGKLLLGQASMTFYLPTFLLVILVALGADYNIFIASRIQEARDNGEPVRQAALTGLVDTGPVISSAGLILAGTFASLLVAPIPTLRIVALAVSFGVLLDTYLIRPLLVPALIVALGDVAFWPQQRQVAAAAAPHGATRPWALPSWYRPATAASWGAVVAAVALLALTATQPSHLPVIAASAATTDPSARTAARDSSAALPTTPGAVPAPGPRAQTGRPLPPGETRRPSPVLPRPQAATSPGVKTTAAPIVLGVPQPGNWSYHVTGTRKIGAAGSTQPFSEDDTTVVDILSRTGNTTHVRLRTSTRSESDEDQRDYLPNRITLTSTSRQTAGQSFSGTLDPAQLLLPWPAADGQRWSSDWTTGKVSGHTDSRVTARRRVSLAGQSRTCVEVTSTTTLTGDISGTIKQTSCWLPDLGVIVQDHTVTQASSNGVPYDTDVTSTLFSQP